MKTIKFIYRLFRKKAALAGPPKSANQNTDLKRLIWFFYLVISLALAFTAFGAGPVESHGWSAMTALLWALSSMAAGIAIGFLFGIPKILQAPPRNNNEGNAAQQLARETAYRQQVNTNLTEISDWLTKIIVGLGLIDLKEIPPFIRGKAAVLAESLKQADPSKDYLGFSVAVIVGFTILGFLFGYIFTRVYLSSVFAKADLGANQLADDAISGRLESLRDTVALVTTEVKQLASSADKPPTKPEPPAEMKTAKKPLTAGEPEPLEPFSMELTRSIPVPKPLTLIPDQILKFANAYNEVKSPVQSERVILRDELANKMATIINRDIQFRDWAVSTALEKNNVGLVVGLATAINAGPIVGDSKRLFAVAHLVPYLHARYKVTAAIGSVFDAKIAIQADVAPALSILTSYTQGADGPLQRRIRQTLAQISQSTGQNVSISGI